MTDVLIRDRNKAERRKEDSHIKREPETRFMQTQAKECLGIPEAGEARKGSLTSF